MSTSRARLAELENIILELERELDAMAGYEEQYPEHYQQLVNDHQAATEEYLELSAAGDQSYSNEPYTCVDELTQGEEEELMSIHAPVCGEGDTISLNESVWDTGSGETFIVATGCDAFMRVMRTLPNATPAHVSDGFGSTYVLTPGEYNGTKMFVASIDYLYFLDGNNLIQISKADFPRSELLDAMGEGMQSAAWLEKVGKVGFAFLVPFMGAVLLKIGLIASIATITVKMGLWYAAHHQLVSSAKSAVPIVAGHVIFFSIHCPELYGFLMKGAAHGIPDLFSVKQWESEDVADVLGRIAGGVFNAPSLAVKPLAALAIKSYLITSGLRRTGPTIGKHTEEVKQRLLALNDEGIQVLESEAEAIAQEGCLAKESTQQRLKELSDGWESIAAVTESAAKNLRIVD